MTLEISASEKGMLVRLLEAALADTRVEVRRTTTPEYHDRLRSEEEQLEALVHRVRSL